MTTPGAAQILGSGAVRHHRRRADQAACVNKDRIDYLTVDASLSFGPVFARHLGHRMYRGEYFAMQTDVHARVLNSFFVCEKNDAEVSSAGSHMGESIF